MREKRSQSEIDGVHYHKAKGWQVAMGLMCCGTGVAFSSLIGMISYLANSGYGIVVGAVGIILTASRVFDGIIDPFIALLIDRMEIRFGKIRIMMTVGLLIRILAVFMLYVWGSGKEGPVFFVVMYLIYIFGNSVGDIATNMIGPVLTNDPRQRPAVSFWSIAYNALGTIAFTVVSVAVILPMFGNQYTNEMLATSCLIYVAVAVVLHIISCIGLIGIDKPEYFASISEERVKPKDMWNLVKDNRPFQMYVIAAVSDKIANQATTQAVVGTIMFGILMGNMAFGTILNMIVALPAVLLSFVGAGYAGKHGAKKATVVWTWVATAFAAAAFVFCLAVDMRSILVTPVLLILFVALKLGMEFGRLNVSTVGAAMRSDIIDYELMRSGKYLSAVVTSTYNFIDQIVSSVGMLLTTSLLALIGYSTTMPQPTDAPTISLKLVALIISFILPILGWICTIVAMKFYKLDKEAMVQVQKSIEEKKHVS